MFELAQGVSLVQPGDARGEVAIAFSLHAVAGGAGGERAGLSAAEGDKFAGLLERVIDDGGIGAAGGAAHGKTAQQAENGRKPGHRSSFQPECRRAGSLAPRVIAALVLAATAAACKPPVEARHEFAPEVVERGRAVAAAAGCAACHALPGIDWPRGDAGPDLTAFDGRGPIAGALPNTPANLAAFVRNAPLAKPGSTMPAMPITQSEARAVAAYLYGSADD